MTALRAGNGGTHGSRPTGCGGHSGRAEASDPTRQNRNRAKRDVEGAVPYEYKQLVVPYGGCPYVKEPLRWERLSFFIVIVPMRR